jgi:(S)-2-hydroxyglutarate dehydrogenase
MPFSNRQYEVAVIGGGVVGTATSMAILRRAPGTSLVILEAEGHLAVHQTGHNSGVIHAGLYYRPGSLKAQLCVSGREALYRFCAEHGIQHERCGKLVLATHAGELPMLDELERRGRANGLTGLRRLRAEEISEYEPHARGVAALLVPETGIVNYAAVTAAYAAEVRQAGGQVETDARVHGCRRTRDGLVLETARGDVHCLGLINCAGLYSDRVARLCGVHPASHIVPFRGEYYEIVPERHHLVRNLIYPVPAPRYPFLGVHFTRTIDGGREAGPNAVLAWLREGYKRGSFSLRDTAEMLGFGGFWRMGRAHWRMGLAEAYRSMSTPAFVSALQRMVPELHTADVRRAGSGVRAQALGPDGKLLDDFHIVDAERMIHVLNAPSPAATASIAIGETIAARAVERFGLLE